MSRQLFAYVATQGQLPSGWTEDKMMQTFEEEKFDVGAALSTQVREWAAEGSWVLEEAQDWAEFRLQRTWASVETTHWIVVTLVNEHTWMLMYQSLAFYYEPETMTFRRSSEPVALESMLMEIKAILNL